MTLLDQLYWNGSTVFESVSISLSMINALLSKPNFQSLHHVQEIKATGGSRLHACAQVHLWKLNFHHFCCYSNNISCIHWQPESKGYISALKWISCQSVNTTWNTSQPHQSLGRCLDLFTCLYQCSLLGSGISALNLLSICSYLCLLVLLSATHLHVWVTLHST